MENKRSTFLTFFAGRTRPKVGVFFCTNGRGRHNCGGSIIALSRASKGEAPGHLSSAPICPGTWATRPQALRLTGWPTAPFHLPLNLVSSISALLLKAKDVLES